MGAPEVLEKHNNDPKHKKAVEFNNSFLNNPELTSQVSKVGSEIICNLCGKINPNGLNQIFLHFKSIF
jgi:hypothetical protein